MFIHTHTDATQGEFLVTTGCVGDMLPILREAKDHH